METKGKSSVYFQRKLCRAQEHHHCIQGPDPFVPACEVVEYMNSDAGVILHRYKEFQIAPD